MIRELIFGNLGLKLLAVGLAVGLWMSVAAEPVVERGLDAPLGFENLPNGLHVAGDPPDTVHVRVRGAMSIVNGLAPGDVVAVLDLAGEQPGHRRLFDLFAGRVRVPFGVEVTQVVPSAITVTVERVGPPRAVAIVPDIQGQPAPGFAVGRIAIVPPRVDVIGPHSRLADLSEALTEPVSIAGATARVQAIVTVGVADPLLRLETPASAEVTVEIVTAPMSRTLHELPVYARGLDDGRRPSFAPRSFTVGIEGPRDVIRRLGPNDVEVFADLAGLVPGHYNLPVTVESPAGVGVTHIDPPRVSATLQ